MFYLIAVSIIWSASFGIFKTELASLDPNLVSFLKLLLACLLFLPFFRPGRFSTKAKLAFLGIGFVEYGLMQLMLSHAFQFLNAWQVALMTLFTPLYIVALDAIWKRSVDIVFLLCSAMTVVGAAIAMFGKGCVPPDSILGCLLVQGSDICFALGLLLYRKARETFELKKDREIYSLLFIGGLLPTITGALMTSHMSDFATISHSQWLALVYMGIVSSGICLFWWNVGATRVCTGVLAVLSNIKVPMAVAMSLLIFGEQPGAWPRLLAGAAIMVTAVAIVQRRARKIA